nr:hypothetical protein [Streptomyces sp. NEAU-H3]
MSAATKAYRATAVRASRPVTDSLSVSETTEVGKASAEVMPTSARFQPESARSTLRMRANAWWWLSQITPT